MVRPIPADSKWGRVAPPDQEGTGGAGHPGTMLAAYRHVRGTKDVSLQTSFVVADAAVIAS